MRQAIGCGNIGERHFYIRNDLVFVSKGFDLPLVLVQQRDAIAKTINNDYIVSTPKSASTEQ
jgi:hypothetical protein